MTLAEIVDARSFGEWVSAELARRGIRAARCLDVGAGEGGASDALRRSGHEAVAIDPREPVADGVLCATLESFEDARRFDVVVARLSLHHTENVGAAARALRRHVRDDGLAFVAEYGWELADEATVAFAAGIARRTPEDQLPPYGRWLREVADMRGWVERLGELHAQAAIDAALRPWFETTLSATVPHITPMLGREDLVAQELAAIASGAIVPLGVVKILAPRVRET